MRLRCKLVICNYMFMLSSCIVNLSLLLWSIYIACRLRWLLNPGWFQDAARKQASPISLDSYR
jgi:hypothetical protein